MLVAGLDGPHGGARFSYFRWRPGEQKLGCATAVNPEAVVAEIATDRHRTIGADLTGTDGDAPEKAGRTWRSQDRGQTLRSTGRKGAA
jgi:hypothetical protein